MTKRRITTSCAVITAALTATVSWASPVSAASDRTAPTVPSSLRVTSTTETSVSLAWHASTDRSGGVTYRVYVDGGWRGTAGSPAHTAGPLSAGTTYTFVVRALDRYGNISAPSSAVTASTAAAGGGGGAPGKPTNPRVTGTTYDSITLAWDASPGPVDYYLLYRNGLWVNSAYGTSGSVNWLAAGSTHNIEIVARSPNGTFSAPAGITATTRIDTGPPTTPANLRVVPDAQGRPAALAWDASTDDRGVGTYWLYADGGNVFGGGQGVSFYSLTDEFCTVFSGQTYSFTVRAVDLSGNLSAQGTPVTVRVP